MLWLISLVILHVLSGSAASSWNSFPHDQVNCGSSGLPCLHIQSGRKKETTPSRDINTWYPIPKWRILSHFSHQRNTNGYSEPYFNKQDMQGTDGNIHDNNFSSVPSPKKSRTQVFERLNIQFLPLKDGNITVKGLQGRINDRSEEYVALFVVYKHSNRDHAPKTESNFSRDDGGKKSKEFLQGKEHVPFGGCDEPDGCILDVHKPFLNSSLLKNGPTQNGEEIFTVPVSTNMSIEMKVGQLDDNNYTVIIMPLNKLKNITKEKNRDISENDTRTINVTLTSNMSMVMRSSDVLHLNESLKNDLTDRFTTGAIGIDESLTTANEFLDTTGSTFEMGTINTYTKSVHGGKFNDLDNIQDATEDNMYTTTSKSIFINNAVSDTPVNTENINYIDRVNNNDSHFKKNFQNINNTVDIQVPTKLIRLEKESSEENTQPLENKDSYKSSSNKGSAGYTHGFNYYEKLGTYEVKKLDGEFSPSIVTIHLAVTNNGIRNETDYIFHISSRNVNNSEGTNDHFIHYTQADPESRLHRIKRKIRNGYSLVGQEIYRRTNKRKEKIIRDEFVSHENKINNKYSRRRRRVILNKTKETVKTINQFSLISLKENTLTRGQNNISRLFLLLQRPDSYSFSTIANSNEEFNKDSAYSLGREGLISSEMPHNGVGSEGTESNQTAHGDRIRREVSSPALIPNKDAGENRSLPKKSELQIVERAPPLHKYPNGWKLKTPLEEHSSLRNGFKGGKICYLGDHCKRINDAFNSMNEFTYHEVNKKNKSFDLNRSAGANAKINRGYKLNNYALIANMPNKSLFMKAYNRSHMNKRTGLVLLDTPFKYRVLQYLNSITKLSYDASEKPDETYSESKTSVSTDFSSKFNVNKLMNSPSINIIAQFNHDKKLNLTDDLNIHLPNSLTKITHDVTEKPVNEIKKRVFLSSNNHLLKTLLPVGHLSRKRRAAVYSPPTYTPSRFYMSNLKVNPNQMYTQTVYAPLKQNSTSVQTERKQVFDGRQQNFRPRFIPKSSNVRSENINAVFLKSNDKEIRRGSIIPMIIKPAKVGADSRDGQEFTQNGFGRDYTWIIIAPEFVIDHDEPTIKNSKKSPVFDKDLVSTNVKPNTDREREDFDWEKNQWMLITPESEHHHKNTNTLAPPSEQKPDGIVHIPAERPDNCITTKKPVTKTIPRRTTKPQIRPFPYTTLKPDPFPNSQPATNPWDSNGWPVQRNPWTGYPSRSVMMPGMAGGD